MSQAETARPTDKALIISEPLCYILKKIGNKVDEIKLKQTAIDFYTVDQISTAKDILVRSISEIGSIGEMEKSAYSSQGWLWKQRK